jgi:hypothetical protein
MMWYIMMCICYISRELYLRIINNSHARVSTIATGTLWPVATVVS